LTTNMDVTAVFRRIPQGDDCPVDEDTAETEPFKVYIKSKPHRYGMKIWTLCDSVTMHDWNFQVYCGKMGPWPERDQGRGVVLDLVQGLGKGYGESANENNLMDAERSSVMLEAKSD
ncbi:hypothetical protein T4E_6980, partial [Trichinella pseudospiralis]